MNKKIIIGYAIGPIGLGVVSFVSLPLITWFYSIEDIGRISMLQVFTNFAVLLFSLGLDQSFVREYYEAKNKASLLKTVVAPSVFLSIIFFSSILIFSPTLISNFLFDISNVYLSVLSIICFVLALLSRFLGLVVRMQERSFAYSMSQLLPKILFLIFILLSVVAVNKNEFEILIQIHVLAICITFLVFSYNTRKEWVNSLKQSIDFQELKKYLIYGFPLIFGGLASWGLNVMDRLFLKHYSSYTELGLYSVTVSIAGIVAIFSGVFNTIWTPLVYKWVSEGETDYKKIDEISEYLLLCISIIIILSAFFSWIVPLFLPEEYIGIKYLITICLIGPLFYTLSETTAIGITITRKTKFSMFSSVLAVIVSVLLNYILVPCYGAKGAAISTATAFFVFFIVRSEFSKLCWRKVDNRKKYFICFLILVISIQFSINLFSGVVSYLLWVIFLFYIVFSFKNAIKVVCEKISRIF